MDLNGDENLEWLVGAEYPEYYLQNWLLINKQADGLYHFLPGFDYDLAEIQEYSNDIEIYDLTGDGNSEIVKIQHYYMAGKIHGNVDVYTWNQDQLSLLKSIPLPSSPPIYGEASDYTIDDFDGDGLVEIRVDSPQFRRFDCQWVKTSTYHLDEQRLEVSHEEIPQTDECLIARALESEDPQEQIQLYQEAIAKLDLKNSPSDKLAWLKLQLAMAYTAQGDDARAMLQIKDLHAMEGNGKFQQFLRQIYENVDPSSPLTYCDALYTSTWSRFRYDGFGSEIDIDLTYYVYPISFIPEPELVCPFPTLLDARLAKLEIPITESPIDVLTSKGYSFAWTQPLDWDHDNVQEWLGVFQFTQPILVVLDSDKKWMLKTIEINPRVLSDFEIATSSPQEAVETKVLFLFSSESSCNSTDTEKWLIVVPLDTMQPDRQYLCDSNQYSLSSESNIQHAIEEFSKPNYFESFDAPDWYHLPGNAESEYEPRTILDLVSEIENEVAEQANPNDATSRISELTVSLPKDDPAAQILLNRLYYLRGLNYELSGQKELAVKAYLDLIALSPELLWSHYAQLRIYSTQP